MFTMKLLHLGVALGVVAAATAKLQVSSSKSTSLSLEAVLSPLNATHLKVSIQNTYPQAVAILNWNNHFQHNQNGAHGSFKVVHLAPNGSSQIIKPAPNRPTYQFLKPVPSHFVNITGRAWFTAIFDITQLFDIPRSDYYNITMDFVTRATLLSDDNELPYKIQAAGQAAEALPNLKIESKPLTMALDASSPDRVLRRRSGLGPCSDQHQIMPAVLKARDNARALAKYAQNVEDPALWAEYFNNSAAELRVKRVYQGIINYGRNGNYYGITEYCDPINEDPECTDDEQILAYRNPYQAGTNTTTITFCTHFMYLQPQMPCNYPSSTNPSMVDQGGLFLHELTHARSLVGYEDISDGRNSDCYSWDCIQQAVAGQDNEIPPWHIGRAYEMYAYAARALGTKSCQVDAAIVDNIASHPSSSSNLPGSGKHIQGYQPSFTASTMLPPAATPTKAIFIAPVAGIALNSTSSLPTDASIKASPASSNLIAAVQAAGPFNNNVGTDMAQDGEAEGGGAKAECVAC